MCVCQAVDTEKRLRAVQEGSKTAADLDPVPTNDLEYEDKRKFQESQLVYDGLRFNLSEHNSDGLYIHNKLINSYRGSYRCTLHMLCKPNVCMCVFRAH